MNIYSTYIFLKTNLSLDRAFGQADNKIFFTVRVVCEKNNKPKK